MFRVEVNHEASCLLIKVEGKLAGAYAEDARSLISRCESCEQRVIDLTEVTSVDRDGEQVLLLLKSMGAEFLADTAYARYICERLGLPTLRRQHVCGKPRKARA